MKNLIITALAAAILCSCGNSCGPDGLDYGRLNSRAATEYLTPVRPGGVDGSPFWNEFAVKFMYAPSFDFKTVEGAAEYRFTVTAGGKDLSFKAPAPTAVISPIWNDIPEGEFVTLAVDALDRGGNVLGRVGERSFWRDYAFSGPYAARTEGYRSSAVKALLYIHGMDDVKFWRTHDRPDASHPLGPLFGYTCKILGHVIRCEMLLASLRPEYAEEALAVSRNVASYLIACSQPEGAPVAFFPPTYDHVYGTNSVVRLPENQGKTMMMEAVDVAHAFLDLYDATAEKEYYDRALGIADTYRRLQKEDGSWPIKIDIRTAEPVIGVSATPTPVLQLVGRLAGQYGITEYNDMRDRAERWLEDIAMPRFDLTGQFEDVSVEGLKPYQNLTNSTTNHYANYLLSKETMSETEARNAEDLARFCEDQFVSWRPLRETYDVKDEFYTPGVVEQYRWRAVVDASVAGVAEVFLGEYQHTGDRLWLAKARALADQIVNVQNTLTGRITTTWRIAPDADETSNVWINCTWFSARVLLRFADAIEEEI